MLITSQMFQVLAYGQRKKERKKQHPSFQGIYKQIISQGRTLLDYKMTIQSFENIQAILRNSTRKDVAIIRS